MRSRHSLALRCSRCWSPGSPSPTPTETRLAPPTPTEPAATAPPVPTDTPRPTAAPAALQPVYAETDGAAGATSLWIVRVDALDQRVALATLAGKPGYGVSGAVSLDGTRVAYVLVPPDADETAGAVGELWVQGLAGEEPQRIASAVSELVEWAPDGTALTFARWAPDVEGNWAPAGEALRERRGG